MKPDSHFVDTPAPVPERTNEDLLNRGVLQFLFSAATHVGIDKEAKEILGQLGFEALCAVREGREKFGIQQVWSVETGPIDHRFRKHWDDPVAAPVPEPEPILKPVSVTAAGMIYRSLKYVLTALEELHLGLNPEHKVGCTSCSTCDAISEGRFIRETFAGSEDVKETPLPFTAEPPARKDELGTHWTQRSEEDLMFSVMSDFTTALEVKLERDGISQDAFAEKAGVTPGRISQLLNDPTNLEFRTILKYAKALGMKVAIVAYEDGDSEGKLGPIHSAIFEACWKKIGSPRDLFGLEDSPPLSSKGATVNTGWTPIAPQASPEHDLRKQDTPESKEHWDFVAEATARVEAMPEWKKNSVAVGSPEAPAKEERMPDVDRIKFEIATNEDMFKDFLYSRNKWHMLCTAIGRKPADTCVADITDQLARLGLSGRAE